MTQRVRKCKKCSFTTYRLTDMRTHWQDDHANDFSCIDAWLREDNAVIATLEQTAKEGMIGHNGH